MRSFPLKRRPMELTYESVVPADIDAIYGLCKDLIDRYEDTAAIDYPNVLAWVRHKIASNIGTAVIEKCCAEAPGPVMLCVFIRNTGALALYRRLGFRTVRQIGDTRLILRKE